MIIELKDVITWSVGIVGFSGVWFGNQFKVNRLDDEKNELKEKVNTAFKRIDENRDLYQKVQIENERKVVEVREVLGRETVMIREQLNVEIAKIQGAIILTGEQLKQVLAVLSEIKDRMVRLESK